MPFTNSSEVPLSPFRGAPFALLVIPPPSSQWRPSAPSTVAPWSSLQPFKCPLGTSSEDPWVLLMAPTRTYNGISFVLKIVPIRPSNDMFSWLFQWCPIIPYHRFPSALSMVFLCPFCPSVGAPLNLPMVSLRSC